MYSPSPNHPYPLQVDNCDSISRFVVDKDSNAKFGLQMGDYDMLSGTNYLVFLLPYSRILNKYWNIFV